MEIFEYSTLFSNCLTYAVKNLGTVFCKWVDQGYPKIHHTVLELLEQ